MIYSKKSLGQNFLIDKNIIRKIVNLTKVDAKDVVEIGPGKGALTDEILKRNPKSIMLIEKDDRLFFFLKKKYYNNKIIKIFNKDILKINLESIIKKKSIIFGNLPYNISSQILVKIIKFKNCPPKFNDIIFMFQKELGEKIVCKFPSSNYGRLSILTHYKLNIVNKFLISPNCFFPKPKINSMIIHFQPKSNKKYIIKNIDNLEKITNVLFSNKRKMINKNIKKILYDHELKNIPNLKDELRPAELKPELYYKITELIESR